MADLKIRSSEITPEESYLSRREFIKSMAVLGAGALIAAACQPAGTAPGTGAPTNDEGTPGKNQPTNESGKTDEQGDPANTYEEITNYNNYYEFTTDKEGVAQSAKDFPTSPWEVEVGGLVGKPGTFAIEDLLKKYPQEERIYRLRCVEAWSMVIPWVGFPLSKLLKDVEPTGDAKYVRFVSLLDPEVMPGQRRRTFPWPYQEGLRIDEAMHDLTLMVTGLYGKPLPPQDGAPLRLVVPWKYGFKGIKAIVKIELVEKQPETLWSTVAPQEYGFYANVNPEVSHPRWSQASERRIGEFKRRETLMFNGYADQVSSLYEGMDLRVNY